MVNKFPRLWDRLSILMIIICIWLPAALLQSTGWAKNLDQVELLALLGVVIGILLGKTALSAGKAHLIFAVLSVIIPLGLFTLRMTPEGDWSERIASLGLRANMAVSQTMTGQVVQDPLVFVMFCAYFFWIIGYFTGYGLTRRWNPWQGLLASAGIFGVIDFYAKSRESSFWIGAALVLLLFLLASRLFWLNRKLAWEREGYFIERDAGESVIRLATILGIILVLFAWNLETIIRSFTPGTTEYERVSDFWKGVQSSLQNNFMALESTTSLTGTYPGGMKLGEQTPSNPEPAFFVDMVTEPSPAPKYYWRVKTFYEYRNGEWQSPANVEDKDAAINPEVLTGSTQLSKLAVRYFWQAGDGSVIPYTGRFSTLDIPFRLESSRKPVPVSGDVQVYPLKLLTKGDVFHLESAVYAGGPSDLQKINYSVPQEIAASSLQIPETVPNRVRELGVQIAVGDTTAERVMNVTRYLRSQIAYKNRISTPPAGRDPVDWFLFEKKEGFCTYYASAEVILLRAAGIPARLAVGYSQGERVENTFLVKLNDAHAWPEVYYPEVGWLPYEPTVIEIEPQYSLPAQDGNQDVNDGLSPEERRGNQGEAPQPEPNMGEPEAENGQVTPARWITYILIAILVILILVGLWFVIGRRYWKKPPRLSSILLKWLRFLHIPIPRWLTWWDWYTGLSDIAIRYYWIEKLAVNTGFVSISPSTPSELLTALAVALPECRPDIDLFHQGLYRELYSRDKVYSRQECRAAGAALQRDLVSGIIDKLIRRRTG